MAQVIVCCAQKGGCAKTVTVHNLSTALSQMGKKILAVDFDAQASLTICFGIEPRTPSVNIAHLMDMQAQDLPTPPKENFILHCSGIDLIPSSSRLSAISEMLRHEIGCDTLKLHRESLHEHIISPAENGINNYSACLSSCQSSIHNSNSFL